MNVPIVSVVMATYNRSNLLQYSIGSLIRGNYQDWELIVVGDYCTDDTEQVIAGFNDSRIRFVNLAVNVGEQSGPNNQGVAMARGQYIAFLNHDDIWCDNHLQINVTLLESTGADLVFSQGFFVPYNAPHSLIGANTAKIEAYAPWMSVPSSLWVFKKSLTERVGEWRLSRETARFPSQDWLYRAHRKHSELLANPMVTVVIVNSGSRTNAYSERQVEEHQYWYKIACDPSALSHAVSAAFGGHLQAANLMSIPLAIRRLVGIFSRKIMLKLEIWPPSLTYWMRYHRKGSYIKYLRKRRGLPAK